MPINNNLHIWELGEVFRAVGSIQGTAYSRQHIGTKKMNKTAKKFEDLEVWQKAYRLVLLINSIKAG